MMSVFQKHISFWRKSSYWYGRVVEGQIFDNDTEYMEEERNEYENYKNVYVDFNGGISFIRSCF